MAILESEPDNRRARKSFLEDLRGDQDAEPVDAVPIEAEPAPPPTTTALAAMPEARQPTPFLRPQPTGGGSPFVYLTPHTDYPSRINALMHALDSSFDRTDYLYAVDTNAYWKRKYQLDDIFDWVVSQVEKDPILKGRTPGLVARYDAIEDGAEDREEELRRKARFIGSVMGHVGLALKEQEPAFKPVPQDRMKKIFGFVDHDLSKSEFEIHRSGIPQLVAYFKENMIDLGLDVFLVIDLPRKVYPFGSGKSTLAVEIAGCAATAIGTAFDLRRDVAYQMDVPRIRRFLEDDRLHQIRVVDEGKRIWSRRKAMHGKQAEDMQTLSMTRKRGQIWIAPISNIYRYDLDIFEERSTHLLRILDPGRVTISRGWGQAILYEKGDYDEEKDLWGNRRMKIEWVDLPGGPKRVYGECIRYTNRHAAMILDDDLSPLDELLREQPDWNAELLAGWPDDPIDWDPRAGDTAPISTDPG